MVVMPKNIERSCDNQRVNAVASESQKTAIGDGHLINHHWNAGFNRGHSGRVQFGNSSPGGEVVSVGWGEGKDFVAPVSESVASGWFPQLSASSALALGQFFA